MRKIKAVVAGVVLAAVLMVAPAAVAGPRNRAANGPAKPVIMDLPAILDLPAINGTTDGSRSQSNFVHRFDRGFVSPY